MLFPYVAKKAFDLITIPKLDHVGVKFQTIELVVNPVN